MKTWIICVVSLLAIGKYSHAKLFQLEPWVQDQLKSSGSNLVKIIDTKAWSRATTPNAFIILGIKKNIDRKSKSSIDDESSFVLLVQSTSNNTIENPKLLASADLDAFTNSNDPVNVPKAVDVAPFQIKKNEFVFGIRYLTGSLGNKGGAAFEILELLRFQNGRLKEVFSDVVWAYGKFSNSNESCNSEMTISSQQNNSDQFFKLIRRHKRSYFGNLKNPEYSAFKDLKETSVKTCDLFKNHEKLQVYTWNQSQERYLDRNGRFLKWDDLFK